MFQVVAATMCAYGTQKLIDDEPITDRWDAWFYRRIIITERDKPDFFIKVLWWLSSECRELVAGAPAKVVREQFVGTEVRTLTLPCAGKYALPIEGTKARFARVGGDDKSGNWNSIVFFVPNDDADLQWERIQSAVDRCYNSMLGCRVEKMHWDTKDRFWMASVADYDPDLVLPHPAFDQIQMFLRAAEDVRGRRQVAQGRSIGFLIEGVPGTGKTHCAYYIAAQYNRPVYLFPAVCTDNDLQKAMMGVRPNSVLLIDDIDRSLDDNGQTLKRVGWSITGLLRACDQKAPGAWLFMCTNDPAKLDRIVGLTRAGRFDRRLRFEGGDSELVKKWLRVIFRGEEHAREIGRLDVKRRLGNSVPISRIASAAIAASAPGELVEIASRMA